MEPAGLPSTITTRYGTPASASGLHQSRVTTSRSSARCSSFISGGGIAPPNGQYVVYRGSSTACTTTTSAAIAVALAAHHAAARAEQSEPSRPSTRLPGFGFDAALVPCSMAAASPHASAVGSAEGPPPAVRPALFDPAAGAGDRR